MLRALWAVVVWGLHLHVERDRCFNFTVTSLTSASFRTCPAGAVVLCAFEGDEKTCHSDLSHSDLSLKSMAVVWSFLLKLPLATSRNRHLMSGRFDRIQGCRIAVRGLGCAGRAGCAGWAGLADFHFFVIDHHWFSLSFICFH